MPLASEMTTHCAWRRFQLSSPLCHRHKYSDSCAQRTFTELPAHQSRSARNLICDDDALDFPFRDWNPADQQPPSKRTVRTGTERPPTGSSKRCSTSAHRHIRFARHARRRSRLRFIAAPLVQRVLAVHDHPTIGRRDAGGDGGELADDLRDRGDFIDRLFGHPRMAAIC